MVAMEREVPGNTADRIWQAPIQMACPPWMSSIFQVLIGVSAAPGPAFSQGAFIASMIHITMPPTSREAPIT